MDDTENRERHEAVELAVLDEVAQAADSNAKEHRLLARRIGRLRDGRARGRPWDDLLAEEPAPGTLHLVERVLRRTSESSGRLRRALANGLRREGTTVPAIAKRFGVSHQRVSALLRHRGHAGLGEG